MLNIFIMFAFSISNSSFKVDDHISHIKPLKINKPGLERYVSGSGKINIEAPLTFKRKELHQSSPVQRHQLCESLIAYEGLNSLWIQMVNKRCLLVRTVMSTYLRIKNIFIKKYLTDKFLISFKYQIISRQLI